MLFSQLDIYLATYPDRMHHLDLGLFNYQVTYTREILKDLCGLEVRTGYSKSDRFQND